jgi:hypothetical protein
LTGLGAAEKSASQSGGANTSIRRAPKSRILQQHREAVRSAADKLQCNKIAAQQSSRADLQPQLIEIGARRRDCVPNTLAEGSRLALFLLVHWLRCDPKRHGRVK